MKVLSQPSPFAPHQRGHSHNDEMQSRPLAQALQDGFTSIEVDVHLVKGRLLVGHSAKDAEHKNLSLEDGYLDPLKQRVEEYGSVYPSSTEVTLMLDFKGSPELTYKALKPVLAQYQSMLVQVQAGQEKSAPVRVVITGNQPQLESLDDRSVFLDGSLRQALDQPGSIDSALTPTVQGNYRTFFRWNGQGSMSPAERKKLDSMVATVHSQGLRMRLWDAPDQPRAWDTFLSAGVDRINTDDLDGYANWQSTQPSSNTHKETIKC